MSTTILPALARIFKLADDSAAPLNTDGGHPANSLLTKSLSDIVELLSRDRLPFTLSDLPAYNDALWNSKSGLDDRKFLLEKLLVLMSRLPSDSEFSARLQDIFMDTLYKDLPHPPRSYVSQFPLVLPPKAQPIVSYAYRSVDGFNYNPLIPTLGQAGTPYARSVPSTNTTPLASLPDPGLLFDTLLRRRATSAYPKGNAIVNGDVYGSSSSGGDGFVRHPGGVSSLFFAFADLVIHSIFDTAHGGGAGAGGTVNNASSYLDLSPLYGSSERALDGVRRRDGTGRLWEDVFADGRLLLMPPAACALLVVFCRNHNYVAEKLLAINERRTFRPPALFEGEGEDARARLAAQDEELFQRARLVNCGYFMQVIFGDYVGAILGLARDGFAWRLDPLETIRRTSHDLAPQGEGNACSIEFNMLYRWHATLSERDTEWTEKKFREMLGDADFDTITPEQFIKKTKEHLMQNRDVKAWTFDGLTRDESGRFRDADLARILQDATEWYAGAFRARGTPAVMRVVEVMGILQARSWGTCSMNEFRRFLGLKPYANFEEWNPNPEIHKAAAALYHDIENLELHVGLQAEETKEPMPGAGLCPGYTISRAILADAVCLTRGDRYLTVDFTPHNLTSWGYQDCQRDATDGSYGGMLTKLLFRHLGGSCYPRGSAYAHFPFMVPEYMEAQLARRAPGVAEKYGWVRPLPTVGGGGAGVVGDGSGQGGQGGLVRDAMHRLGVVTECSVLDYKLIKRVVCSHDRLETWGNSFAALAQQLINEKSVQHAGRHGQFVDIVKDVINLIPVHWIANEVCGLPLKSRQNLRGVYREQDLYEEFANVGNYILLNLDPVHDWTLREKTQQTAEKVMSYVEAHLVKLAKGGFSIEGLSDSVMRWVTGTNDRSAPFLKDLVGAGDPRMLKELAASLFAEVVPTAALWSKALVHVVEFFLDGGGKGGAARAEVVRLSREPATPATSAKLLGYVYEALQHEPIVPGVYMTVANGASAHVSDVTFWDHGMLSRRFFEITAVQVLRVIFRQQGLKRGPARSGELDRFKDVLHGTSFWSYVNSKGEATPWPASLIVEFDGNRFV